MNETESNIKVQLLKKGSLPLGRVDLVTLELIEQHIVRDHLEGWAR